MRGARRGIAWGEVALPTLRSEELAAITGTGDLSLVDLGPAHNRARDEVVRKGLDTNREHGIAVFNDGSTVSFGGEHRDRLAVPRFDAIEGSVTVHHNHSFGDSLSRADLFMLFERAELGRVDAHGHAGLWASAQRTGGALARMSAFAVIEDAVSRARRLIQHALERGQIDLSATRAGLYQIVAAQLLEQDDMIRYALNSNSVLTLARNIIKWGQ
ncbi:hypothetical protein CKO42_00170 [Lamprobacter modestohalophilus]|uniref:Uncharacterized protein n=1 Tax=Lamprobacter modestohalophilus TaxID=1064514 RepID=A0A9X1B2U7_9GAMM|nr:hypothetical protein [Lamprobacter modestohalophilus]